MEIILDYVPWKGVYSGTHIRHRLAGAQVVDLHIVDFVYEHFGRNLGRSYDINKPNPQHVRPTVVSQKYSNIPKK